MTTEIRVPTLGESVVEATVGAWLKHEGDQVEAGEPLVSLETEKVNVEVAADQSGVLGKITAGEGETVHPGDVIATIDEAARTSIAPAVAAAPSGPPPSDAAPPSGPPPSSAAPPSGAAPPSDATAGQAAPSAAAGVDRPHASPVARRMAEEHGLDLARVEGTGTAGRVTREDVERYIQPPRQQQPAPAPVAPALHPVDRV